MLPLGVRRVSPPPTLPSVLSQVPLWNSKSLLLLPATPPSFPPFFLTSSLPLFRSPLLPCFFLLPSFSPTPQCMLMMWGRGGTILRIEYRVKNKMKVSIIMEIALQQGRRE